MSHLVGLEQWILQNPFSDRIHILVKETDNEQTNTESGTIKFGEEKEKIKG